LDLAWHSECADFVAKFVSFLMWMITSPSIPLEKIGGKKDPLVRKKQPKI
jgi:hypothetical protein